MYRFLIFCFLAFCFFSCDSSNTVAVVKTNSVHELVDEAIANAGGDCYEKAEIRFNFRNRLYVSKREGWKSVLQRETIDSLCLVTKDVLDNSNFQRFLEDMPLAIPDSIANNYSNSVNSVHYFSQLPFGLNDKAVTKKLVGESIIKGEPYHKIEVTFAEEDGGDDFDDVYLYWIHKENWTIDYLAYEFHVNGGGKRFREAYNARFVNGIRFVDYKNYKPMVKSVPLVNIDSLYQNNGLKLLSRIELDAVTVSY